MINRQLPILLIEDNPGDARLIQLLLEESRSNLYQTEVASTLTAGLERLSAGGIELVMLDLSLPDSQGMDGLFKVQSQSPDTPVVILTGNTDEKVAIEAVSFGAQDYLIKGEVDANILNRAISYALERQHWQIQLKQKNAQLASSESNLRILIEENIDGMLIVGKSGIVEFANSAAMLLFIGQTNQLVGSVFPYPLITNQLREIEIIQEPGKIVIAEMRTKETSWNNEFAYLVLLHDITEQKQYEQDLKQMASYDSLTGLPNRALYMDRLLHALQRCNRTEHSGQINCMMAVVMLDLDGFKAVNDTYGHTVGDQLLKAVAERLQNCLRQSDTVARYGGDEFMLILEDVQGKENSTKVIEKILLSVREPFNLQDAQINISLSVGISLFPWDGRDAGILIDRADIAMYRAKKTKDSYCYYSQTRDLKWTEDR